MVQSKADRERQKLITDKCQSLIEVLLKDVDNKYCVDCDAKGPRWASWNLGVFLCIRCAGIHRNLGVHISKVKSVNLDAWTPEHVAYVQRMGNSRARAVYEANLPDDFRRPQTDTALESFIRAKYEHKKYIAQDYVDPGPPAPAFNIDDELKKMKEQKRSKVGTTRMISVTEFPTAEPKPRPSETSATKIKNNTPGLVDLEMVAATEAATRSIFNTSGSADVSGISTGSNISNNTNKNSVDLLLGVDFESPIETASTGTPTQTKETNHPFGLLPEAQKISQSNILDLDFNLSSATPQITQASQAVDNSKKPLTKESILSLYSFSPSTNMGNTAGQDPFGLNTTISDDPFKLISTSTNFNPNMSSLSSTTSNTPVPNPLDLINISTASGLSDLLGGSNNSFGKQN